MTTATPRLPARFAPFVSTIGTALAMAGAALPLHAQRTGGGHPGIFAGGLEMTLLASPGGSAGAGAPLGCSLPF